MVRLNYLRIATIVAFLTGILFSHRLWFGSARTFPRAPFISSISPHSRIETVLSFLLIAILCVALIRSNRAILILSIFLLFVLVLLDQNRLQPWVYQYGLTLVILSAVTAREASHVTVLSACQLLIGAQYFWSGLQKLNWSFAHSTLAGLLESAGLYAVSKFSFLPVIAVLFALVEVFIGVGLLSRRTRNVAVIMAIAMHVLLLVMLIVSKQNSVIWPWNLAMIAIVIVLFRRSDNSIRNGLRQQQYYALKLALLVVCVAPVLSFLGWFDSYLSFALYSTPASCVIRIDDTERDRLPANVQPLLVRSQRGDLIIPVYKWAMDDLNVPEYPEERIFRQVGQSICRLANQRNGVELIVRDKPDLFDGRFKVTRVSCAELGVP
jgi:hypothetical protein